MTRLLLILLLAPSALATTYVRQTFRVYYDNAEYVSRIYVTKAELLWADHEEEKVACGERITADVIESFKGDAKTLEFVVSGMLLSVGEQYFVFVESATAKDVSPMTTTNSRAQRAAAISRMACSHFYGDLTASWLSTSEFVTRWSKEKQAYEPWLVPAYNIDIPNDAGITHKEIKLRALSVDGEIISSDFWSVDRGIPMPDVFWMYQGAYEWESYKKYIVSNIREMKDNKSVNPTR